MNETSYYQEVRRNPFIVAYWRLNDKIGKSAIDWANKYDLNGIYKNEIKSSGPLILEDTSAGSYIFGDNILEVPDTAPLRLISDFSIEAWVIPSNDTFTILAKMNSEATYAAPYRFGVEAEKLYISVGNGSTYKRVSATLDIKNESVSFLSATYYNKVLTLFINGESVISEVNSSITLEDKEQPLFIGSLKEETNKLEGNMAEVAIYKGALSPNEIKKHFEIGRKIREDTSHVTTFDEPNYS